MINNAIDAFLAITSGMEQETKIQLVKAVKVRAIMLRDRMLSGEPEPTNLVPGLCFPRGWV